jgi:curved DNA-binding protein CbpA
LKTGNYYEILEVDPSANQTEIKRAYTRKIRVYSNETHPEEFQIISKAYKTLMEAESRLEYDHSIQDNGMYQSQVETIQEHLKKEEYELALSLSSSLLREYPNDKKILYLQALSYHHLERFPEAESILKNLVLEYPREEDIVALLASQYLYLEDYERAKKLYQKLIDINPLENNYFLRLSNCFMNQKQNDQASKILENKLSKQQETVYDFPLLSELYFLTVLMDNFSYHDRVVNRIKALPKNADERKILLNMMMDLAHSLDSDHFMFKEIISIISTINNGNEDYITKWVKEAESYLDRNKVYYGDSSSNRGNNNSYTNNQNESAVAVDYERGSILWSVVIGIILSFFITPIGGIIAGIVYYYKAGSIKAILKGLGCIILILLVLGFIISSCGM